MRNPSTFLAAAFLAGRAAKQAPELSTRAFEAAATRSTAGGARVGARREGDAGEIALRGTMGADEDYFLGRMASSLALAQAAANSIVKLVHFELAGRYSLAAVAPYRKIAGSLDAALPSEDASTQRLAGAS